MAGTPAPKPTKLPTHIPTGKTHPGPLNTATHLATTAAHHWIILATIAAYIGLTVLFNKYRKQAAATGKAVPPLGNILSRYISHTLREDKNPILTRPENIANKTRALTWHRLNLLLIASATTHHFTGRGIGLPALILLLLTSSIRASKTFKIRRGITQQMFEVAAGECRYPKGAELTPWRWVQVQQWEQQNRPGATNVSYPPKYDSENPQVREKFERQFNGTVSDEHSWTYKWESSKNRVICAPTPFLPTRASYPRIDKHPWNEFPLGLAAEGKEAIWDVATYPHCLIAGPTGSGKLQTLCTDLPTPDGWTTMGDVRVGDQLLDETGQPCTVTKVHDVVAEPDLYEVVFSDGSIAKADAGHLWWTETRPARESRWSAAKRPASRRPLLPATRVAALRTAASTAPADAEVTIPEAAALAGIDPAMPWLHALAAHLGPVAERQFIRTHTYTQQTVTQKQTILRWNAQTAYRALAGYIPQRNAAAWNSQRPTLAALAAQTSPDDIVSSREISTRTGITAKKSGAALRQAGLSSTIGFEPGGGRSVAFWNAQDAWSYLAGDTPAWLHLQQKLTELADAAAPNATITNRDLCDLLGLTGQAPHQLLRQLGHPGTPSRETVTLAVPAQQVEKTGPPVRLYNARRLLTELANLGELPAHDQRHLRALGAVRTTAEIRNTLLTPNGQINHSIPVTAPLDLPHADLPIDPYLLGVWLGDGYSRGGAFIGIDHEIAQHITGDGHTLSERRVWSSPDAPRHEDTRIWTVRGLTRQLRHAELLKTSTEQGETKRIPTPYLRASITQRRALLAGLMDTDGSIETGSSVAFNNSNRILIDQTYELAASLGYRPTITERMGAYTKNGIRTETKTAWRVNWSTNDPTFRISRKINEHAKRAARYGGERAERRYITNINKIATQPGRCIEVDSPNRLFLTGRSMIPTHNSVTQRVILLHALQSPDWRIVGIDPKRVEMSWLKGLDNVLKIATNLEDGVEICEDVELEMRARYDRMESAGVNHFRDLNPKPSALLLMVDETFAFLSPEGIKSDEGKARDEAHARASVLLGSIARLGRASGIHLALATQRPDAKVLSGEMKNNLDARIATGRMDTTPSLMVLDSEAATRIPAVKGRGVLRLASDTQDFQTYFTPLEDLAGILEEARVRNEALLAGLPDPTVEVAGPVAGPSPVVQALVKLPVVGAVASKTGGFLAKRAEQAAVNERVSSAHGEAVALRKQEKPSRKDRKAAAGDAEGGLNPVDVDLAEHAGDVSTDVDMFDDGPGPAAVFDPPVDVLPVPFDEPVLPVGPVPVSFDEDGYRSPWDDLPPVEQATPPPPAPAPQPTVPEPSVVPPRVLPSNPAAGARPLPTRPPVPPAGLPSRPPLPPRPGS